MTCAPQDLCIDSICAGKLDKTSHGSNIVYLNKTSHSRDPIRLQLGVISMGGIQGPRAPYGVSSPYEGSVDTGRYNVELCDLTEDIIETVQRYDDHLIKMAVANAEQWFNKKMSEEVVRDRFVSPLKIVEGKTTTLRIKVSRSEHTKVYVGTFDPDRNTCTYRAATIDAIRPSSTIVAVVDTPKIWFMPGGVQFGYTYNAGAVMVKDAGAANQPQVGIGAFNLGDDVEICFDAQGGSPSRKRPREDDGPADDIARDDFLI